MQAQHTDQRPQDAPEFGTLDKDGDKAVTLAMLLSGETFSQSVAFPVIVEGWEKKRSGRVKRAYLKEFTESERKKLSGWHTKLYRWHLVSGVPRQIFIRPSTLQLLQRACAFFGAI